MATFCSVLLGLSLLVGLKVALGVIFIPAILKGERVSRSVWGSEGLGSHSGTTAGSCDHTELQGRLGKTPNSMAERRVGMWVSF